MLKAGRYLPEQIKDSRKGKGVQIEHLSVQYRQDQRRKGKIMEAGTEEIVTEIAAVEKLRIKELDEHIPLGNDGFVNESNTFRWYRIRNQNDYHILNTAYRDTIREPSVYPEIICVETVGQEPYQDDAYAYHLADCRKVTEDFWKQLGYQCTIQKK